VWNVHFPALNMSVAPHKVAFGLLPKTSTGKIQKFELRERARKGF